MGFTEAVRTVLREKYVTFSGRASRSEFWWFQLFYWLVAIAFGVVIGIVAATTAGPDGPSSLVIVLAVIAGLFMLAMFLPQLSVQVRRFHDRNISGWWYLGLIVVSIIPYVNVISGLAIFVISVLPGTVGPNKFGADPLRPEARAAVFA